MQHADQLVADARTVANATSSSPLLDVRDLTVTFPAPRVLSRLSGD